MRVFLSGWQASNRERELAVIQSGWLKARCFSFAMVQQIPGLPYFLPRLLGSYQACLENKVAIMMDSGVVSWRSYRVSCEKKKDQKALGKLCGESEFIAQYVDYVKKNWQDWAIYMTIDMERVAANIFERHKKIEAMGIKPVPVFHGDDSVEYIQKYADLGHKLVAIASWRTLRNGRNEQKAYLDAVFRAADKAGVGLHGLAFTAPWQLLQYPWASADSSSWSRVAGFGGIMRFDAQRGRMSNVNVSTRETATENLLKLNVRAMQAVQEEVEAEGFDFQQLREDFVARHVYNARTMHLMAEYATQRHGSLSGGWQLLF